MLKAIIVDITGDIYGYNTLVYSHQHRILYSRCVSPPLAGGEGRLYYRTIPALTGGRMNAWFSKLISDKNGNPNEHIIAAIWGSFTLLLLAIYLIYTNHAPTLIEFGGAHGAVWGSAGVAQKFSSDS
jgi:hypothetical protein